MYAMVSHFLWNKICLNQQKNKKKKKNIFHFGTGQECTEYANNLLLIYLLRIKNVPGWEKHHAIYRWTSLYME